MLKIVTSKDELENSKWFTYGEEDEKPVRIKIRPWGRTAFAKIEKQASDREYIRGLKLDWGRLPAGLMDRKDTLRNFLMADAVIEDWENVGDQDGKPLECDFYTKVWAFESLPFLSWCLEKGRSLAGEVAEDEAKN